MKKTIIFISPNSLEMMNMCAINYAHNLGYETAVAVDYHNKLPINTDYVIYTDTNNTATLIFDLAVFNLDHEIAGITTYSDYHVETTALANEYFNLNGPNFPAVQRCKNKLLCRMELNLSGWKQPKSILIKN